MKEKDIIEHELLLDIEGFIYQEYVKSFELRTTRKDIPYGNIELPYCPSYKDMNNQIKNIKLKVYPVENDPLHFIIYEGKVKLENYFVHYKNNVLSVSFTIEEIVEDDEEEDDLG